MDKKQYRIRFGNSDSILCLNKGCNKECEHINSCIVLSKELIQSIKTSQK